MTKTAEELAARVAVLEGDLAAAHALTREHLGARLRAEAALTDARNGGIRLAIRWIRGLPRLEVVVERVRVGELLVQRVASVIARRLEERLEASEEITRPSLPDSGD